MNISKKTMKMLDSSMKNFAKGIVGPPIELPGKKVSRKKALEISQSILKRAERSRNKG